MGKNEIIFVVALIGGMIVAPALVGQWYIVGVAVTFFICFGIWEWIAVARSGRSISQKLWDYSEKHKWQTWVFLFFWLAAWLALCWHFAAKLI